MKKLYLGIILLALIVNVGCSTKVQIERLSPEVAIKHDALFAVGDIKDDSGYATSEKDEQFNLKEAMSSALSQVLTKEGLNGNGYEIKTTILQYSPGNAFARWLIPGAGATKLQVECEVYSDEGILLAKIPVERMIAAGGGYTIGAWKYVFTDVAEAVVGAMKKHFLKK